MTFNYRNFALWAIFALLGFIIFQYINGDIKRDQVPNIPYSEFLKKIDNEEVKEINMVGPRVSGVYRNNNKFTTYTPADANLIQRLEKKNVIINAAAPSEGNGFLGYFLTWLPLLIILAIWIFFMRQMQGGGKGALGFGKSKAKLLNEAHGKVTFGDVAGVDEAKADLEEIVDFLKDPKKFQKLGGRIPRGVLLVGPPGTGKTLLARAVAGEANVPFFSISGSDFVEMFVGVGASRVRDMFEQAKKNSPCIIFIDEIDAVGRQRGVGLGGGNDEREQTLNQLLVEMDGFEANQSIILIAATNRPDVLDPALLRPGRFDRQVVVPNPDVIGREQILKVHVRNVPLAPNVDLKILARGTPGFSGAELMNLVNEAALMAARRNKRLVTMQEFEDAKDKVMMGAERRSNAMTQAEKELTAYHEAGHAVVALHVPHADPVHKATIIPRGRALGMVMQLPEGDRYSVSYRWMLSRLVIMMGGRVAEELQFGKDFITSGASSDIEQATKLARSMVMRWGFSDSLGRVAYGRSPEESHFGYDSSQPLSDDTAKLIDKEIRRFIDEAYQEAIRILTVHRKEWHAIALGLLEYETLTGEEIQKVMLGEKLVREDSPLEESNNSVALPKSKKRTIKKVKKSNDDAGEVDNQKSNS
ncbi:ATP-dependent zinc metalloprotease FtsH [Bartonella sp. DGB1]|uniref:ATP-dependent zinc metalloprotease FtsH n=1 Tax=Bartonella sp. DGB1 TaxID=3239807 RepID=UPI003525C1FD